MYSLYTLFYIKTVVQYVCLPAPLADVARKGGGGREGVQGVTILSIYQLMFTSGTSLAPKFSIVQQNAVANNGTSVSPLPHTSGTY
jgi:hypothetical protein